MNKSYDQAMSAPINQDDCGECVNTDVTAFDYIHDLVIIIMAMVAIGCVSFVAGVAFYHRAALFNWLFG